MKNPIATLFALSFLAVAAATYGGDEELCLDCHVPAEDWEGMTSEEILETAADTSIKRHADNAEFSEEQLKVIVATLIGEN